MNECRSCSIRRHLGAGVCMVRSDLPGSLPCPILSEFRRDAQLRTNFRRGEASFQMVEHLMAALYGLQVDNCLVEVDAEELPGLDGSAPWPTWRRFQSVGLVAQSSPPVGPRGRPNDSD